MPARLTGAAPEVHPLLWPLLREGVAMSQRERSLALKEPFGLAKDALRYGEAMPAFLAARLTTFMETSGFLEVSRDFGSFRWWHLKDDSAKRLGWSFSAPAGEKALESLCDLANELGFFKREEHAGEHRFITYDKPKPLKLAKADEAFLRQRFPGSVAFYEQCLAALPDAMKGKRGAYDFRRTDESFWHGILAEDPNRFLRRTALRATGAGPRAKVLDLCHGTGASTLDVLDVAPEAEVTCLDFTDAHRAFLDERIAEFAKAKAASPAVHIASHRRWPGFGAELPFEGASFDVVSFMMSEAFIPRLIHTGVFREIHRVLKPGGAVAMVTAHHPPPDDAGPRRDRVAVLAHDVCESVVDGWQGFHPRAEALKSYADAGFRADGLMHGLVWVLQA